MTKPAPIATATTNARTARSFPRFLMALAMAASVVVVGCGDGGPTEETDIFPDVSGNWRGTWSSSSGTSQATLSLNQNGNRLNGTLTVGRDVNTVSGTVDTFGVVNLTGQDATGGCTTYFSDGPDLGLSSQNSHLDGPMRRRSSTNCGGRFLNQGGTLTLDKIL